MRNKKENYERKTGVGVVEGRNEGIRENGGKKREMNELCLGSKH